MGLFMPNAPVALQPVSPPLGIHPNYCVNQSTVLVLKEKAFSFTGDNFAIKDASGVPVCQCQGKVFSFRDRKVITSMQGQVLYVLKNKILTVLGQYYAEDESGREVFRVKRKFGLGTKMEATFHNASTKQDVTLVLRGDMWGGSANIAMEDGPVIAQIGRKLFNAREIFMDRQTYFVTVAPGVDLTLIAAICICFDEAKNEKNN